MTEHTLEELIKICEPYPWEFFEEDEYGTRVIENIIFRMRVGLYLNKPVQAIMCGKRFVRVRDATQYENCFLYKLDPADSQVNHSIYVPVATRRLHPTQRWRPQMNYVQVNFGFHIIRPKYLTVTVT